MTGVLGAVSIIQHFLRIHNFPELRIPVITIRLVSLLIAHQCETSLVEWGERFIPDVLITINHRNNSYESMIHGSSETIHLPDDSHIIRQAYRKYSEARALLNSCSGEFVRPSRNVSRCEKSVDLPRERNSMMIPLDRMECKFSRFSRLWSNELRVQRIIVIVSGCGY